MLNYRRSSYQVVVAGQDVTDRFDPLLQELTVTDKVGATSDTCSIELADPDGTVLFPSKGDPINISLANDEGMAEVFRGTVDEVRSTGSKKAGHTMSISGKGIDTTKKVKEPKQKHKDDATLGDVAQEWGKDVGLEVRVHDELASIKRVYWDMRSESFINWGRRVADEIGAIFKVSGDRAMFVPANEGKTASGQEAPTIRAVYGDNLQDWSIVPVVGRPQFKKTTVRFFDKSEGKWKEKEVEISAEGVTATGSARFSEATEDQAEKQAKSDKGKSERKGSEGSVTILGNPIAKAGGRCVVVGARPGIDGTYRITTVTHKLTKGDGLTTTLELDQAQGEAGKDSRK